MTMNLSRVVWSEGMHLGPHHFQAQSRYFEDSLRFSREALWFSPYGVLACHWDGDSLRNGSLRLQHARGLFPDGLAFDMPGCDPLPDPLDLKTDFSSSRESLAIFLAVREQQPGGVNCEMNAGSGRARYQAEPQHLIDEINGADVQTVAVGRKNIRLLAEGREEPGLSLLPVARIQREGRSYRLDGRYIPPCLQLPASESLLLIGKRLVEILAEKSEALGRARKGRGRQGAGFSSQELITFWFLYAINTHVASLRHLLAKNRHPEELYFDLAALAGALCTFATDSQISDVPSYDHLRLQETFETLDRRIRRDLEILLPTSCLSIPLQLSSPNVWTGKIADGRCVGPSQWILAMRSSAGELEMISGIPRSVKLCSASTVGDLVRSALPGLALKHLPVPPPSVSRKLEYQYFTVNKSGVCWEQILQRRTVGIHVPAEFPKVEIELLVSLEA